jgi:hypothetical protein
VVPDQMGKIGTQVRQHVPHVVMLEGAVMSARVVGRIRWRCPPCNRRR